ncbi:MAG: DoxX family protein [Rubrobacteraceae bacterium]
MGVLTVILQVVLGLAFLGAGGSKLAGARQMKGDFDRFGYPRWFMYFTGGLETVAALGVLAGIFVPVLALLGGLLLVATMVGAIATHVRMKDPGSKIASPAILLSLAIIVLILI